MPICQALPLPALQASTNDDELGGLLARVRPFSFASPSARRLLASASRRQRTEAGSVLWRADDHPLVFSFVRRGLVKMVRPRAGGRSDIIGIFGPGEAVGIVSVLRGVPYPASAVAASARVELIHIPRAEVLETSHREPAFATALAQACADRAARMRDMHAIVSAGGVESRLAAFFLDLADRFGDSDEDDDRAYIPIALSRRELASCTATTQESAIRTLSKWSQRGLVRTEAEGFFIGSLDALREIAEPPTLRPAAKSLNRARSS